MDNSIAPPIRYDVGQADFNPAIGERLVIYLDGEEQESVISYDAEAGYVVRYHVDGQGNYALSDDRDEIVRETCHGHVEVRFKDS